MRPDQTEFAEGLRLAAIAAVAAVVTATLVIGLGGALLPDPPASPARAAAR